MTVREPERASRRAGLNAVLQIGSPVFAEVPASGRSNSEEEIDEALATLTAHKSIWANLGGLVPEPVLGERAATSVALRK
jgi:hypothetical protein